MKNFFLIGLLLTSVALVTSCKKSEGAKASVSEAAAVETQATGVKLPVNLAASVIDWEGTKPTGAHTGTLMLSDGHVTVDNNTITGGEFTIDMNSIVVTDLEGDSKAGLEAHLKGTRKPGEEDHFFNVAKYPTGSFVITKVTKVNGDENANYLVYGNLTLKGQTKEVGFKAQINSTNDAVKVETPKFTINRTEWGVNYSSKSVFENLGDKFINDDIGLTITLSAAKPAM